MVTKYSGRTGTVGGRTKLVLTYSPTSVKNGTASVKVTAKLYWDSKYRTQDAHNTVKMTGSLGSWTGGSNFNGTSKLLHTLTKTVSTSYTSSKKITVNGYISGVEASPGSHPVSASITIPKRPVAKPAKPTNVTMSLLSDNRTKTSWSSSPTTAKPVTSYTVQYRRLDGDTWTGWMHSATVKGKSYTSNPGVNNKSYQRRVRANNAAGSSAWANSTYVRMQPYAPSSLKARVKASGSDIEVTWTYNNPPESTCFKLQLQRRVNGGSWANVSSSFGQVKTKPYTASYTDTNPGNGSNQYRIRILNNCEGANSVWRESNTVSTIVPPKAPDHLKPDGEVVDFTQSVNFTWQHHDDGDGADQSHFELRYREDGGDWTTIGPEASADSEHLFEAGELENGVDYEWQVRTQGNTKEGFGPWSKSAFVTGWTAPVVAIKEGAPPNPLTALPVPVAWTYSQDEGQSQIEWQARLYELGSGDVFDSILEEKSAESASTSTEFDTALADGERYGLMVRARSSQGQWSEWAETTFDVELLVPAELNVDLDYDESIGQMNLHVFSDEPAEDETAAVVSVDVERRINGGEWVPIMVGIPFDAETTLVDNIPSTWGVNEYRVTATTEAPSKGVFGPFRKTVTPYVGNTENWLFLNWGETFDYMARMQGDLSMDGSYDRSKETQKLLGRRKPISLLGEQLSREHSVSGTIEYYEHCEYPDVPDTPAELAGSAFFDDAEAWNYSKAQSGSDSRVAARAHYRAKRYGYLIDVPDGNEDDLISPSPRSGVDGTEIPGREVEEVVETNLWRGSKLSEDGSALGGTANGGSSRQTDEGKEWTMGPEASGAQSYIYTSGSYRVPVDSDVPYSWAIPVKNTGDLPIPAKFYSWLERSTSGNVAKIDQFIISPGEIRIVKLENLITEDADDIRFSMYYNANDEKPPEGAKLTILDGITLVADDVAADPFNGDGAKTFDDLLRRNVVPNGSFRQGDEGWSSGSSQTIETVDDFAGKPGTVGDRVGHVKITGLLNRDVYLQAITNRNEPIPVLPGEWIAFRAWVAATDGHQAHLTVQWQDADGETSISRTDAAMPGESDGEVLTHVVEVPDDAVTAKLLIENRGEDGDGLRSGDLWVDAVIGIITSSEGESRSQLEPFFDGDTEDTGVKRYAYLGGVGKSASGEYQVSNVLRHNLAQNASFENEAVGGSASRATAERQEHSGLLDALNPSGDYELLLTSTTVDRTAFRQTEDILVSPGQWVAMSVLGASADGQAGAGLFFYEGPTRKGYITEKWATPASSPTRFVVTREVPEDTGSVTAGQRVYSASGGHPAEGVSAVFDDLIVSVADSEDEALSALEPFFYSGTPDTPDTLYRRAADGSSIMVSTDSQSLYRWDGDEADSESEKYLPAVPEHFEEYDEWLNVEPGVDYTIDAFVAAPDLRSVARRNLTSQGTFATDRRLWGSQSLKSGVGASWEPDSEFDAGAVRVQKKPNSFAPTPIAYLDDGITASTLGLPSIAEREFTFGIDAYAEDEETDEEQSMTARFLDSEGEMIDSESLKFVVGEDIERHVFRFTTPANTATMELRLSNPSTNSDVLWSNVTFEDGETDGDWIDNDDGGREWLGAENIDVAQLMVETFDADGDSLGDPEVIGELEPDSFSNRWRTISGEVSADAEAESMRVWVQWVVNGEHPERQSDWYFGGVQVHQTYSVPERWPGPDANPNVWRDAQYESTTVCLRTPSGHRVFGAMSGLEITSVEGDLDLAEVAFNVTETDYTENPLVVDESDIWEVYAQEGIGTVIPGELDPQDSGSSGGGLVLDPYVGSEA